MKESLLSILCCPKCRRDIYLEVSKKNDGEIVEGTLKCVNCNTTFPIRNSIPRFISFNYYANSFGMQWKTFAKTQLDNDSRIKESELRFHTELGWEENELENKMVIELGSGAGRFVDVVSRCKVKLIVGVDATDAVDAAWDNLSTRKNVAFVQADIFSLPFKEGSFDYSYSVGVLHHTPDPHGGFLKMIEVTKTQGSVGLSLYERTLYRRPSKDSLSVMTREFFWALNMWRCEFFRFFTTRMPGRVFLSYCKVVVPILHYLNKVPVIRYLRYLLPSTCYKTLPVEWSVLDTHDTYATKIVNRYSHKELFHWYLREGMGKILVHNGRTGWVSLTGIKQDFTEKERDTIFEEEPTPL